MASSSGFNVRIDDFCLDALLSELVRRLQGNLDRVRGAGDGEIGAAPAVDALAERDGVEAFGNDAILPHEPAVLEDQDGIVVLDRREHQALGVERRRRHHDLQSRHAEQHALDRL
jgi:hypothetical protein